MDTTSDIGIGIGCDTRHWYRSIPNCRRDFSSVSLMKVLRLEETSTSVQLSAVCLSVAVPLLLAAARAQPLPHLVLVLQPQRVGGPAQRRRLAGSEPCAESIAGWPGVAAALPASGPPAQTAYAIFGNMS